MLRRGHWLMLCKASQIMPDHRTINTKLIPIIRRAVAGLRGNHLYANQLQSELAANIAAAANEDTVGNTWVDQLEMYFKIKIVMFTSFLAPYCIVSSISSYCGSFLLASDECGNFTQSTVRPSKSGSKSCQTWPFLFSKYGYQELVCTRTSEWLYPCVNKHTVIAWQCCIIS